MTSDAGAVGRSSTEVKGWYRGFWGEQAGFLPGNKKSNSQGTMRPNREKLLGSAETVFLRITFNGTAKCVVSYALIKLFENVSDILKTLISYWGSKMFPVVNHERVLLYFTRNHSTYNCKAANIGNNHWKLCLNAINTCDWYDLKQCQKWVVCLCWWGEPVDGGEPRTGGETTALLTQVAQPQQRATFPISLQWGEIFRVFKWDRLTEHTSLMRNKMVN